MADKTVAPAQALPPLSEIGSAAAPFIYFDGVPNFGFNAGVVSMTLEAIRQFSVDGKIAADRVAVAHLRMSIAALASLKSAIEGIELLAQPAPEGKSN